MAAVGGKGVVGAVAVGVVGYQEATLGSMEGGTVAACATRATSSG